ncbi:hypothetical protein [Demequina salsinemoris]|uniref:hypothetical protein n=1 Tax=Demequina salsinemoris TaxID=577470 RepID=UPI000786044F|nr:hypothetical protein [Demequina salsinemoris]
MSEIHEALGKVHAAESAGILLDDEAREGLQQRVGRGRRKRAVGTALASVAAVGLLGVATVAVAQGVSDVAEPAVSESSLASASAEASASASPSPAEVVYDDYDGPVEVPLVAGGTVEFSASSEADAGSMMSVAPVAGPSLDPIDAETLDALADSGALVRASKDEEGDLFEKEWSRLYVVLPDGTSQEVVDMQALSDELGLGVGGPSATISVDPEDGRALLGFDDLDGNYALLLWDMESGDTTILAQYTDAPVLYTGPDSEMWMGAKWDTIAWDGERWLVWETNAPSDEELDAGEIASNVMLAIAPDGSWSTDGMWVDQIENSEDQLAGNDDAELPGSSYSVPGVALWLGGADAIGWFAVNDDGSLTEVCPAEDTGVQCRVIGTTADGDVVVMEGKQPYAVDPATGERAEMTGVSKRAALGGESAPLGDGYVELPYVYDGTTTAIWHRPDGDVEIDVPDSGDYTWADSTGTTAWIGTLDFGPYVAVIGEDGVWHEIDLGLDPDDESISTSIIVVG